MNDTKRDPPGAVRFSLRALVLLTTIAAMVVGLITLNRNNRKLADRNKALTKENQRLRDELGELSVDDDTQLHAIQTSGGEDLEWEWRVWVPKGHEYRLRGDGGRIPKEGWPTEGGTIFLRTAGEYVIRYRIFRDPRNDKWYGSLSTRGGSVGKDLQEWVEWGSSTSRGSGVGATTQAFSNDKDKIVELCRHLVSQQESTDKIEDPASGFVIWLERMK